MSVRCLNTFKSYSRFNFHNQIFSNNGFKNAAPNNSRSVNYSTWWSLSKNRPNLRIIFAAVTGLGVYSTYKINKNKDSFFPILCSFSKVLALEEDNGHKFKEYLSIKPTRKIRSNSDKGKYKLTFFQYQSCPFCCKVRAYLDYNGFSYDIVEVNSLTRKEIKWAQGYKKVPILMVRNEQTGEIVMLKDSSAIISCLQTSTIHPETSLSAISDFYPTIEDTNKKGKVVYEVANRYSIMYGEDKEAPKDFLEVKKWREWTDSHFVHTISPNLYRTPSDAYNTFKIFSKVGEWEHTFNRVERATILLFGSTAMYVIGKMLKKRHNLSQDVRRDLYGCCDEWMRGVKRANNRKDATNAAKFMGGPKPNLADLSVYGVLNAMEGTLAFDDALQNSKVGEWFYAVKSEIASNAGKRVGLDAGQEEGEDAAAVVNL